MNRNTHAALAGVVVLVLLPRDAAAQYIPPWLVVGALSPLAVLALAVLLGLLARSWRTGALHGGLVVLWVLLFLVAAYFVENDYVIWTPMVLYAAHALLIMVLIIAKLARRLSRTP